MTRTRLDIDHVRIGMSGTTWPRHRAGQIARLAFRHVQELTARDGAGSPRTIERVAADPVRVTGRATDDEIARAVAAAVYQSVRKG
jgi:hypothetical protein